MLDEALLAARAGLKSKWRLGYQMTKADSKS